MYSEAHQHHFSVSWVPAGTKPLLLLRGNQCIDNFVTDQPFFSAADQKCYKNPANTLLKTVQKLDIYYLLQMGADGKAAALVARSELPMGQDFPGPMVPRRSRVLPDELFKLSICF